MEGGSLMMKLDVSCVFWAFLRISIVWRFVMIEVKSSAENKNSSSLFTGSRWQDGLTCSKWASPSFFTYFILCCCFSLVCVTLSGRFAMQKKKNLVSIWAHLLQMSWMMMYPSDIGVEQGIGSYKTPLCFTLFFTHFILCCCNLLVFFQWCHNKC